jgi:hypothetical protein
MTCGVLNSEPGDVFRACLVGGEAGDAPEAILHSRGPLLRGALQSTASAVVILCGVAFW